MSKTNWDDKAVVLASVSEYGLALIYASNRLKDDKAVVLAAVSNNGWSLEYASDRLKDNESIVLAAVQNRGYALEYSSDRLRSDINFCIECAKKDPDSIAYFLGEAKEIFQAHNNEIDSVEKQNKANEVLLAKLSTGEMIIPTNNLFKMRLFC